MSKTLDADKPIEPSQQQYHPLARDPDTDGFWGQIDRWSERASSWLNPILIKEARQSLKSRQFLVTFFLLLIASCLWTVLGVTSNSPAVYYLPTGSNLLAGYYLVLAIPLIGMVPLAAHRSLAAEIEDDTFEMLAITRLSAVRIVMGKLNSAMLQMVVYFAAIVPCIAFSYLLRGVTLPMIGTLVAIVFMTALLVTSFALLLSTVSPNRAGQTLATLAVVGVIVFAEFVCGAFCMGPVLYSGFQDFREMMIGAGIYVAIGMSCVVLFIKAAAAQIAPVTENRSSGLRWCMFGQQLLWIAIIAYLADHLQERELTSFGVIIIAIYWLLMGTLMLGESAELSPRVQRGLPSTLAGRTMLTWFNPGPDTGYMFAIATGTVGAIAMGSYGMIVESNWGSGQNPSIIVMVCCGYLLSYLGATRLLVLPLTHRFGPSFLVSLIVGVSLLFLGVMVPFMVQVLATGNASFSYNLMHVSNWAWTMTEMFRSRFDPAFAFFLLTIGMVITVINLLLMLRAFKYRRIGIPERVRQDRARQDLGKL